MEVSSEEQMKRLLTHTHTHTNKMVVFIVLETTNMMCVINFTMFVYI